MNQSLRYLAMALCTLGLILLGIVVGVPFGRAQSETPGGVADTQFLVWGADTSTGFTSWFNAAGDGADLLQGASLALIVAVLMAGAAAIMMLFGRVGMGGALGLLAGLIALGFLLLSIFGLNAYVADVEQGNRVDLGAGFWLSIVGLAALAGGGVVGVLPQTLAASDPTRPTGPTLSVDTPKAFNPLASMDDPKQFHADPPKDYRSFDIRVGSREFKAGPKGAAAPADDGTFLPVDDEAPAAAPAPAPAPAPPATTGPTTGKPASAAAAPAKPGIPASAPATAPKAPAAGATKPAASAAPAAAKPASSPAAPAAGPTKPAASPAAPAAKPAPKPAAGTAPPRK